uniref:RRM domain-containing protein n=1 Tax=Globisporangium ultimum (strain ATCC 200006 / CBS 805.95 / DAOM BR144) TaxID=431595 RepID=K3X187_GLOUD
MLHAAEIKSYIRATVEKDDLLYVFGHVLPSTMDLSAICIELAAASGTATITYPIEAFATEALTKLHGVALESQPLIVSYATAVETETNSPDVPMKIECDLPLRLSIADLDTLRLKPSAFAEEKVMGKYQRGEPSTTLYVKNLAKDIQESELRAVFGAVLPVDTRVDTIKIRHFTEGRMKCQAFVEYPSVSLATLALDKIHGVVFKDKPLVVNLNNKAA